MSYENSDFFESAFNDCIGDTKAESSDLFTDSNTSPTTDDGMNESCYDVFAGSLVEDLFTEASIADTLLKPIEALRSNMSNKNLMSVGKHIKNITKNQTVKIVFDIKKLEKITLIAMASVEKEIIRPIIDGTKIPVSEAKATIKEFDKKYTSGKKSSIIVDDESGKWTIGELMNTASQIGSVVQSRAEKIAKLAESYKNSNDAEGARVIGMAVRFANDKASNTLNIIWRIVSKYDAKTQAVNGVILGATVATRTSH